MKLLRVGLAGSERPAVTLPDRRTVDISELVVDLTPDILSRSALSHLETRVMAERDRLPELDLTIERIGAPLSVIGKVVCVGLNYRQHAREARMEIPAEPILFLKAPDTVVGPNDDVNIPPRSIKTDYEVELAIVIGSTARYLTDDEDPLDYIAGYTVSNDVSEREFQLERAGQWDKGKNSETFQPLGPWLVTADEIPDPQNLRLQSSVNGELRQDSTTADMIFPVAELVRYISQFMVLYPGDVVNTGTPQGVGSGFSPGRFLRNGDVVELSISGLGDQRQLFVDATTGQREPS